MRTHFSVVYEGVQRTTGQRVAVKVMALPGLHNPRLRRRFEREIEFLATLRHPNIVPIYDSGSADGLSYFIMPFIDGLPIDAFALRDAITSDARLRLLLALCQTIGFAHQRGVIHRDLKPSNILVDEGGDHRVLDFGLAKFLAPEESEQTLTADAGQLLGTPSYMSPEQAAGRTDDIDVRSDVYALGVVMYRVLTGAMPYPVDGPLTRTLDHIQHTPPVPPHVRAPGFNADLETVLLKALSKERDRRYQTAAELARDVRHVLENEPIDARRDSYAYVLRKTLRRHRMAVAVALGYGVLITAAMIGTLTFWNQAEVRRVLATEAEARAKERFDQVRHLTNTLIFDVHDQIEDLPGTTTVRVALLKTARQYLDALVRQVGDDRGLALELADASIRLGNVLGNPNYAHQGEFGSALEVYEQGLALLTPFFEAHPEDIALAERMQSLNMKIGDVLRVRGRLEEAMGHYRAAERIIEEVTARSPQAPGPMRSLVVCRHRLCNAYESLGQLQEAFDLALRNVELCRQVTSTDGATPADQSTLSSSLRLLATMYRKRGQWNKALLYAEEGREIAKALGAAHPDQLQFLRDVAVAINDVGDLQRIMNQPAQLLETRREAMAIHQKLADKDPQDVRARRDLFISHVFIGDAHMSLNQPADALVAYQAGLDVLRQLAPPDSAEALPQTDYTLIHYKIGESLQKAERIPEAHEQYEHSLEYALKVSARDPSDVGSLRTVAAVYDVLGETELNLGRVAASLEYFRKSLDIAVQLLAMAPEDARFQRDLVISYSKMGEITQSLAGDAMLDETAKKERWREAREWFEKGLELTRKMKDAGKLAPMDEYFLAELTGKIEQCRAREADGPAPDAIHVEADAP